MCLFEDTQRSLFCIYPSITVHTQTLQRTSPWDCWLKISCTQQLLNCINKIHDAYSHYASKSVQRAGKMEVWGCIQPFIWASISILVRALVVDIFEPAYLDAYLGLCVCTCTLLLRICLLQLLCFFCACGHTGMEHGHSATELSSEKRVWARPAVQYLESVFMRGTTTANYHCLVLHVYLLRSILF